MAEDGGEVQEIEMEVEEQEHGTDQATPTTGASAKKGEKSKQVKGLIFDTFTQYIRIWYWYYIIHAIHVFNVC